jgi:hypothetical protein
VPKRPLALPEIRLLLLAMAAAVVLGPLRGLFAGLPVVPFLATMLLFLVPGLVLSRRFLADYFPGLALLPVAFTVSSGIFGILGVPFLLLHGTLDGYLLLSGGVVLASLAAGVVAALRWPPPPREQGPKDPLVWPLRAALLLLGSALAVVAVLRSPGLWEDVWVHLVYVRDYLGTERLALREPYFGNEMGISRALINGWMLEHAALARVAGIDPVELVLRYLEPALVFVALLAFYALGRMLFKSEAAGLLAACLYALLMLVQVGPSILLLGTEFAGRIVEDKFVTKFVFLPVALGCAFAYLEGRRLAYLLAFGFLCWSSVSAHPAGFAIIGLSMAGFSLVYLLVNLRRREAWTGVAALGAAGASLLLLPAVLVLATGGPLSSLLKDADINSNDPDVLANMTFARSYRRQIFELGPEQFIMHPSLLLNPIVLPGLVLGIPFLLWRVRKSLAAQLLLGVLLFVVAVCYVPPVATFFGNHVVVPGQLYRLAWPIPLAAALTTGWLVWEALRFVARRLPQDGFLGRVGSALPLLLLVVLMVAAVPDASKGTRALYEANRSWPSGTELGFDPVFGWMRDNLDEECAGACVVFAPDDTNTVIPAYSVPADIVSFRGGLILPVLPALQRYSGGQIDVAPGALDTRDFYSTPGLTEDKLDILRRHDPDFALVRAGTGLERDLREAPGFSPTDAPRLNFVLFRVDREELATRPGAARR